MEHSMTLMYEDLTSGLEEYYWKFHHLMSPRFYDWWQEDKQNMAQHGENI